MDLMIIRRRMMQGDVLPPKYQRVEHIIGIRANSIIDTGVGGDDDTLEFDFSYSPNYVSNYAGFMGNYVNETSNCWRLIYNGSGDYGFFVATNRKANSSNGMYPKGRGLNKIYIAHIAHTNITMCVAGGALYTVTPTAAKGTTNNTNIAIGHNRVSIETLGNQSQQVKWYYFRIHKQGKLIRDYIPCYRKSDNKAGFYDLVNHTFNPSIGAADFIIPS